MSHDFISEDILIYMLKAKCKGSGLRKFCKLTDLDPGNVSNVINGKRCMQNKIAAALGYEPIFMYQRISK